MPSKCKNVTPFARLPQYVKDASRDREIGKKQAELKRQMAHKQNPAWTGGPTRKADRLVNGPTRRALRRLHK